MAKGQGVNRRRRHLTQVVRPELQTTAMVGSCECPQSEIEILCVRAIREPRL